MKKSLNHCARSSPHTSSTCACFAPSHQCSSIASPCCQGVVEERLRPLRQILVVGGSVGQHDRALAHGGDRVGRIDAAQPGPRAQPRADERGPGPGIGWMPVLLETLLEPYMIRACIESRATASIRGSWPAAARAAAAPIETPNSPTWSGRLTRSTQSTIARQHRSAHVRPRWSGFHRSDRCSARRKRRG